MEIKAERLLRDLSELSGIGGRSDGGLDRIAWSRADLEARAWFQRRIEEFGWLGERDAAYNIFGRAPDARSPRLLIGSHTDSVAAGGRLDGAYGVVAALEVARTLAEAGDVAARSIEIVDFADEEGVRFPCGYLGSKALAGVLDVDALQPAREILENAGVQLNQIYEAFARFHDVAGYLELHIEQGPRLEQGSVPIGVATGILGFDRYEIRIVGRSEHGGTTPFELRADPMHVAGMFISELADLVRSEDEGGTATVGALTSEGGAINFVARQVRFTLEVRQPNLDALKRTQLSLRRRLDAICSAHGCEAFWNPYDHAAEIKDGIPLAVEPAFSPPIVFDARLVGACEQACAEAAPSFMRMAAGTWHDAGILAAYRPAAMLLVPSRGGVTHQPQEFTSDGDLVTGARVLLRAALIAVHALGLD